MNTLTSPTVSNRYDFLDWLRVIAIFVLLFFHTGMIFVGWGWHIENAETLTALQFPMGIAHRLRMPLLFVIAGAGMWFALGNRHGGGMVRERSLRLLLPLVAGMLLIVPPQIYFERLFRGQWDGGYLAFYFERVLQLQPYPKGDFSWHHLWFVAYLYVYVFLLLPLLLWWRAAKKVVKPGAWLRVGAAGEPAVGAQQPAAELLGRRPGRQPRAATASSASSSAVDGGTSRAATTSASGTSTSPCRVSTTAVWASRPARSPTTSPNSSRPSGSRSTTRRTLTRRPTQLGSSTNGILGRDVPRPSICPGGPQ